jgi:hypothetical protein
VHKYKIVKGNINGRMKAMIKSMTGFGKGDSQIGDKYFQVELKSVNHRYMDVSIRLPKMFTYLEENIRNFIKSYLQRGRIEVYIVYKNMGDSDVKVTIDMPLAKEYLNSLTKMDWELAIQSDITTSLIVGFPDVLKVERKEEDEEETWQCLQKALDTALMELIAMRKEEGEKLKIDMLKRLDKIDGLLAQIRDRSPIIIQEYSARCVLDKGALVVVGSSGGGKDVIKLEPSYGLVSRYGIISTTSSLSPLTLVAKEINDLALVLDIISGYDRKDSTSVDLTQRDGPFKHNTGKAAPPVSPTASDVAPVSKVKIVRELSNNNLVEDIKELGINTEEIIIETAKYILPAFRILSSAEFASATARYDGIRYGYRSDNYEDREELYKNTRSEGFGKEAKKTIIFGNHVINAGQYDRYYKKSQQVRSLIKDEIDKILKDGSILLLPLSDNLDENLKKSYKELGSMTGYPVLSIPYRNAKDEYIELSLLSSGFDEKTLIQFADKIEKILDSHGGGE